MLERRDCSLKLSEPVETPAVGEVDWNEWWAAVDKRIQEHVVAERQLIIEAVGDALGMERKRLRENADEFRGPPGRPGKDAKLPRVQLWREDTVFYEGDCVVFNGSLFQA